MLANLCVTALLTAGLAAQFTTSTYVHDTTVGGFGNIAPFGCLATGTAAAARSQILIPAQYLPGPNSVLLGLEAVGNNSSGGNSSVTYSSLRITVSPTTATSLNANFASNLPSPTVVLNTNSLTVPWVANAWTPILFAINYQHNGSSGLVIDIQKIVSPAADLTCKTLQNTGRTDLPRMINALGTVASGANAATTATVTTNHPLSVRLRWSAQSNTVPTVKLRSSNGAPLSPAFGIGTTIFHTVQAQPGAVYVNLHSTSFLNPGQALPPVVGTWWVNGPTLNVGVLSGTGDATTTLTIPANAGLVGLRVAFQSLTSPSPTNLRFTNGVDCIVNN